MQDIVGVLIYNMVSIPCQDWHSLTR